jgi:hypothetical protein
LYIACLVVSLEERTQTEDVGEQNAGKMFLGRRK